MEAVPRMPMIWLDLKEAGDFQFSPCVRQFILRNYGENPDNYNEQLKKLETLRQSAVNVTRDFEGCSILRKYFGQLHYLQSRVPMGTSQEASVPVTWTEIFSGKSVTHNDISYEQACILYNLGALHSMLGAMDNRVSEEGMKVSCTHFQCSAGSFSYLRDNFSHNFSVDMSHQILNLNINLMLGQAQECLLEKSMLDNRKSFLVARISAQVVDYYKDACRALENSETASMLGKIQKDWKKLVQMKIYYFAAIAHLHMGKQAEEQQKYGEQLVYLQSSLDKLTEAVKLAKGQPDSVQEALRFTMDVVGGKFNSAKKDNDFIYHETVPSLDSLASVKGAPLVKALPVNPTDPSVTGPDLFSKLVPMAAHEASSLYSEEKAKLLREVMSKVDGRNDTLEQFMDSLGVEPESVDNLDMYSHIPPVLMEKCAALSVRPDTVKSLIQSMQVLSGVFTDVESSLKEIRDVLEEDEAGERALKEAGVTGDVHDSAQGLALAEISRDLEKYMEAHEKASFTNTELHRAMNLHISNLRLLGGPLESLQEALPRPQLNEEEVGGLQSMKRILGKVQEMRDQRACLEKQLRDLIQLDDITSTLVTTERADIKRVFEEQLKKYEQVKVYIDQNLAAQDNILKALTEANVHYASVRKRLAQTEQQWTLTVQGLVGSYEAYEDLMKKSQEGKEFYDDLEVKASHLLERAKTLCENRAQARKPIFERDNQKKAPARPTAAKPAVKPKSSSDADSACSSLDDPELAQLSAAILALGGDLPEDLRSLPPDIPTHPTAATPMPESFLPPSAGLGGSMSLPWPRFPANLPPPELLARIAQFTPSGTLRGPSGLPPHIPTHVGYRTPAVPVRTATMTVDNIQAPLPNFDPNPQQPAPVSTAGYNVTPQVSPYLQFVPQVGPAPGTQLHRPMPQYPSPVGPPLPQPVPVPHPPSQTHQTYPASYLPQHPGGPPQYPQQFPAHMQPSLQNGYQVGPPHCYQTPQGYIPPQMMSGSLPQPTQIVHSLPTPPVSQPYPQLPPELLHQHLLPHQQITLPPNAQQMAPHQQIQIPGGPRVTMPSTRQPLPPASQTPHSRAPLSAVHHQMPPASQPHMDPGHAIHVPRGPMPQMPQNSLAQQQHPHTATAPSLQPKPVQMPGHIQPLPKGGVCYPAVVPMVPKQPQTSLHMSSCHQLPRFPPPPGGTGSLHAQQMIQPCPGGPPASNQTATPSPSPSPVPSPAPASLCLTPQQRPAPTPGGPIQPTSPSTVPPSTILIQRQNSNTDDLLSSSPDSQAGGTKTPTNVLQPTKADPQDNEWRRKSSKGVLVIQGDPYQAPERVASLHRELERFKAHVESLESLSMEGGLSVLDTSWKELQDQQEKDARQLSIAIARCYSMKNRHQDVMPYDMNRVILQSGKDDYINASYVTDLSSYCPQLIATQAPLTGTAADFWLMVYEQKVSLVVMLVSEQELEKGKVLRYFPTERGQQVSQGLMTLSLTTQKTTPTHIERMISLQFRDQSLKRTVIHLQFTSWPELGHPDSKSNLLRFIQEVHAHYLHQRPLHTPVVVHCSSGVGRTGAFALLYAAVQELEAGNGISDLSPLITKMRKQRKNMLQEKLHLKFCYETLLEHAEKLLLRHGVSAPSRPSSAAAVKAVSRRESQQDLVLGGDMPISSIQATVAKLSFHAPELTPDTSSLEESTVSDPLDLTSLCDPPLTGVAPSSFSPPRSSPHSISPNILEVPALISDLQLSMEESPDPAPAPVPAQSSLELLASLTPEAFSMEGGGKGKQRVTKQSFLQLNEGQGLHGARSDSTDDPLSNLDPLWSLGKH